jgi:hypothetical protein
MFIAFSDIVKRIGAYRAFHLPCITPPLFHLFLVYLSLAQPSLKRADWYCRDTEKDPNGNSKQEMLHADAADAEKPERFHARLVPNCEHSSRLPHQ